MTHRIAVFELIRANVSKMLVQAARRHLRTARVYQKAIGLHFLGGPLDGVPAGPRVPLPLPDHSGSR